ncbi:MAG: TerB family tellurite resistance protein [Deltaproteobacteria bacterium]|nr:MAG: TerB family tellurite resistance protein [Deltaproteobacteria bacterium]
MDLESFDEQELQVFADLVAQMMYADGEISFDELRELEELGIEFGDDFAQAMERAQKKSREEALAGISQVVRQTTRDLILTMLYDMGSADGLDPSEEEFLETVRKAWTFTW